MAKGKELKEKDHRFFRFIWENRPHVSEVDGTPLRFYFNKRMFFVFSHLHSKQARPDIRYLLENVKLKTLRQHQLWEFERHKIKDSDQWSHIFDSFEKLKNLTYSQKLLEEQEKKFHNCW